MLRTGASRLASRVAPQRLVLSSSRHVLPIQPQPRTASLLRRRALSNQTPPPASANLDAAKKAKTRAGTGNIDGTDGGIASGVGMSMIPRGPVSWASLGLVAVAAASAIAYYQIER